MSTPRLADLLTARGVVMHPEKLDAFEGQDLMLTAFEFREGATREAVMLDTVDVDGEAHLIYTSGESIVRLLHTLDYEHDLPVMVKFVRQPTGSGRKVWTIQ